MSAAGNVTTVARSVAVSTGMSVIRRDSTTHDDDSNAPLGDVFQRSVGTT